jgi:hypothetical protein
VEAFVFDGDARVFHSRDNVFAHAVEAACAEVGVRGPERGFATVFPGPPSFHSRVFENVSTA